MHPPYIAGTDQIYMTIYAVRADEEEMVKHAEKELNGGMCATPTPFLIESDNNLEFEVVCNRPINGWEPPRVNFVIPWTKVKSGGPLIGLTLARSLIVSQKSHELNASACTG
jgi:hypothetical protein